VRARPPTVYYGVSRSWINGLSLTFMILYTPGYFLAFWSMDTHGFKFGLVLASILQTVGAWIRYIGVIGEKDNEAALPYGFIMCMFGQCLAGLAQPMFTK
jgi:hypothetical protein